LARFYANENFPRQVTQVLRSLGHEVLTVFEAGKANQRIPDDEVLVFATLNDRAVLTINRHDFIGIHARNPNHAGIVVCTQDADTTGQASRIHEAVIPFASLHGRLIRVNRQPL
jgi:predicted nuclease of predicted toxin-antitoxin system